MTPPNPWAFGWTQVLTIIGLLITMGIAIGGFRTFGRWKREKLEERRIEIAFDLLSLAYETKYVFEYIRGPASFDYEYQDMPEVAGESLDQRRARQPFYAILRRIDRSKDFFERALKMLPRCMGMFGPGAENIFMLMHRARREIEVSAQMLAWHRTGFSPDQRQQMERDIWDMGDVDKEHDRVGQKLSEFRARIEAMCQPIIAREFAPPRFARWRKRRLPDET